MSVLALGGCGAVGDGVEGGAADVPEPRGEVATWELGDDPLVDPLATFFVADVTRLGCAGGETGTVLEPAVVYEADRVLVRIDVAPLPGDAYSCPGNDAVPTEVHLREPLGMRELVDAACLSGEAVATSACGDLPQPRRSAPASDGGVRWAPPADLRRTDEVPDWTAPPDYSFTVQSSCGMQQFIGEYAVTVREGRVANVETLRQGRETPVENVPTLDDMLSRAREAAARGNAEVWIDPEGVPRWIVLDPLTGAVDDESCFFVTDYSEG